MKKVYWVVHSQWKIHKMGRAQLGIGKNEVGDAFQVTSCSTAQVLWPDVTLLSSPHSAKHYKQ